MQSSHPHTENTPASDLGVGTNTVSASPVGKGSETHDASNPAEDYWNGRYNEWAAMWSGRVNPILAREASILTPGTALDLGCGEGGDAIWLAHSGWKVTAVDVSTTALDRAHNHAAAAGVGENIQWQHQDLAEGFPSGEFDLVSAQFLHSPIEMPRGEILRRAAAAVAPGGSLLVVGHFGAPPGAPAERAAAERHYAEHAAERAAERDTSRHSAAEHHSAEHAAERNAGTAHSDMDLPTPEEVLADLNLPDDEWETVVCELAPRTQTAPDGAVRELVDSILRVQRRSK
jgi:SAM-dependent methyltransferase